MGQLDQSCHPVRVLLAALFHRSLLLRRVVRVVAMMLALYTIKIYNFVGFGCKTNAIRFQLFIFFRIIFFWVAGTLVARSWAMGDTCSTDAITSVRSSVMTVSLMTGMLVTFFRMTFLFSIGAVVAVVSGDVVDVSLDAAVFFFDDSFFCNWLLY